MCMKQIHVSSFGNNIVGNGTIDKPFKTIQYALSYVEKGFYNRVGIMLIVIYRI